MMQSDRRTVIFFVLMLVLVSCQSLPTPIQVPTEGSNNPDPIPTRTPTAASGSPTSEFPVSQLLVNSHPSWGEGENYLTDHEVAARFQLVLRDRLQMLDDLPDYLDAGFSGEVYVYLSGYGIAGPEGLESPQAQLTLCTDDQKALPVFGNSVTMDTGDFCEIHDAIISQTALPDYPDIFPTENWFVHSLDGMRFARGYAGTGAKYYAFNPGDTGWQTYYARRALREIKLTDPSHLPIPQATGIFIDNLNSTFYFPSDFMLAEYSSLDEYEEKKLDMLMVTYQLFSEEGVEVIGNLSDMDHPEVWDKFLPYLSGAMSESWVSDWGDGIHSPRRIEEELSLAEKVLQQNKKFMAIFQGNASADDLEFAFANMLLITDHRNAYFKYKNYEGEYSEYYEIPEYFYKLGVPINTRERVSLNPLIYTREFECGSVEVNLSTGEAEILYTC